MPTLVYLFFAVILATGVFYTLHYEKYRTFRTFRKGAIGTLETDLLSNEERKQFDIKQESYLKILQLLREKDFNTVANFQLQGVHKSSVRKYFSTDVKQFEIVQLIPGPENSRDHDTIKVKFEKKTLGYVPSKLCSKLYEVASNGNYLAYVSYIDWDTSSKKYTYLRVSMVVEYLS